MNILVIVEKREVNFILLISIDRPVRQTDRSSEVRNSQQSEVRYSVMSVTSQLPESNVVVHHFGYNKFNYF
jgi:hypothetical protein